MVLWSLVKDKLPSKALNCPWVSASSQPPSFLIGIPVSSLPHIWGAAAVLSQDPDSLSPGPSQVSAQVEHTKADFWLAGSAMSSRV